MFYKPEAEEPADPNPSSEAEPQAVIRTTIAGIWVAFFQECQQ